MIVGFLVSLHLLSIICPNYTCMQLFLAAYGFVAWGDVCPGANIAAEGPRRQVPACLCGILWNVNNTTVQIGGASGEEAACQCRRRKRHGFDPWVRKIPWRRKWQPTPVFLPGKSHGSTDWWTTVHGVTKSWAWLKRLSMHTDEHGPLVTDCSLSQFISLHLQLWVRIFRCTSLLLRTLYLVPLLSVSVFDLSQMGGAGSI